MPYNIIYGRGSRKNLFEFQPGFDQRRQLFPIPDKNQGRERQVDDQHFHPYFGHDQLRQKQNRQQDRAVPGNTQVGQNRHAEDRLRRGLPNLLVLLLVKRLGRHPSGGDGKDDRQGADQQRPLIDFG